MGGMFSAPKPSEPAPPPPPPPAPANGDDEARQQRLDTIARNRRGRAGLIATSDRGLLEPASGRGKSLLGE